MRQDIAEIMENVSLNFTEEDCPDMEAARVFGPSQSRRAFRQVGLNTFKSLLGLTELQPHEKVLDIGCGIGRVALPLTHYLNSEAQYLGIDPVADAVGWCQKNITSQYNNFNFKHVDWSNKMYNSKGTVNPESYSFPWESGQFDVIFLFSVFTHVLPDTLANYLSEIKRMLSANGRVLATMLLVDEEALQPLEKGEAKRPYFRVNEKYWTDHMRIHESSVCFDYDYVKSLLEDVGLNIREPFVRGGWLEKKPGQDILVAHNS